ncbi:MAG: hypothetical protein ACWA5W_07230 [Phycisphaerales bacterium]
MLRNILSVILGYIVMAIVVIAGLSGAFAILGADGTFKPNTYDITMVWVITMFVIGLIAAMIGGVVCAKVSRHSRRAVQSLMLLILILGISMAFGQTKDSDSETPAVREPGISMAQAREQAMLHEPTWVTFTHPFIGCLGIMIGATIVCPCRKGGQPGAQVGDEAGE